MPTDTYDRLSFLDSSFLLMETPTSAMHESGMTTLEAESLQTADGGVDIDAIRDYVASRLHLIPRYDFVADIEASFRQLRDVPTRVEMRPMWCRSALAKRRLARPQRSPAPPAASPWRAAQKESRGAKAHVRRSPRAVDSPVSRRDR